MALEAAPARTWFKHRLTFWLEDAGPSAFPIAYPNTKMKCMFFKKKKIITRSYDRIQFWKIGFQHKEKKEMCENKRKQSRKRETLKIVGLERGRELQSYLRRRIGRKSRGGK